MTRDATGQQTLRDGAALRPLPGQRETLSRRETPLEALTVARGRYARISRVFRRSSGAGPSLSVAVTLAALTGAFLALAIPGDHICVATFRIDDGASEAQRADVRRQLLDFAARHAPVYAILRGGAPWFVDRPDTSTLRLGLRVPDRESGMAQIRESAEAFMAELHRAASRTKNTPTVAEVALRTYADDLRSMVESLHQESHTAPDPADVSSTAQETERLRHSWENLCSTYSAARHDLAEASAEFERLQTAEQPSYGLVPAERRQTALRRDAGLQQDLRELEVNLTELKQRILAVWQDTSPWLERMAVNVDELMAESEARAPTEFDANPDGDAPASGRDPRNDLHASAAEYRRTLTPFASAWTATCAAIRQLTPDPYTGDILNRYDALQRRVNDFLYESAALFSQMRSALQAMDSGNTAQHYVSQSTFVRLFRKLQSAHHQFEFAASALESTNNFRLDAALQAVRGLKRRSEHRIREIERELQAEALQEARRMQTERISSAEQDVHRARAKVDRVVGELIALQATLNASTLRTEAVLRSRSRMQALAGRLNMAQTALARLDAQIAVLAEKRIAGTDQAGLEFLSCESLGGGADWANRAQLGGLGAVMTLIAVLLAQWWAFRRS